MLSLLKDNGCKKEDKTGQRRTRPLFNWLIYWASSKPLSTAGAQESGGAVAPAGDKQTRAASQLEQDIILAVVPD